MEGRSLNERTSWSRTGGRNILADAWLPGFPGQTPTIIHFAGFPVVVE